MHICYNHNAGEIMNIPEDLWHGYICPISEDSYHTHDYQYLAEKHERNEKMLHASLNDSQKRYLAGNAIANGSNAQYR